jgi:aminopeptidase YwaD
MTEKEIKTNLVYLTKEPRVAGSKGGKRAAKYLIKKLEKLGFSIELHQSKFLGWKLVQGPELTFIKPEKRLAKTIPMIWSASTKGKVRGKLVPDGKMFTFEVYPFNKYSIKNDDGEVGFVLSNRKDPDPSKVTVWMQPLNHPTWTTPCTLLDAEDCDRIHAWLEKGEEIEVEFEVKTKYLPDSTLTNIIATKKGETDDTIAICAHYDSILGSTGANDNGSGAVALLEVAKRLARKDTKHTIKLILSDAEEWNKLGTYTYVERLKGKDELKNIKALVNIDTVGAGEGIYCLSAESLGAIVEKGISVPESEFPLELTKQYKSPQFDGWPFHKEGVPVVHFGCRPYRYFHTPMDSIEKINFHLIDVVAQKITNVVTKLDAELGA